MENPTLKPMGSLVLSHLSSDCLVVGHCHTNHSNGKGGCLFMRCDVLWNLCPPLPLFSMTTHYLVVSFPSLPVSRLFLICFSLRFPYTSKQVVPNQASSVPD